MDYYLDTSVITAYYCNDSTSLYAQTGLAQLSDAYISILTEVEFHSAIAKKIRNRELIAKKD